jgi:hypothetical protein
MLVVERHAWGARVSPAGDFGLVQLLLGKYYIACLAFLAVRYNCARLIPDA